MPKTKENRPSVANLRKKNQEKKISEERLSELGSLFKNPETGGHEEESELEEEVDDSNLNLNALEFHQFMELQEGQTAGAPILERIAGSQPRPIFVGGIPRETGTTAGTEESKDEFKYVQGAAGNGEPKYFAEPGARGMPERIDLTQAGRTGGFREEISQERFFMQSEPKIESQSIERFESPERFNTERERQERRNNPFERPEAKYEKYRPKLPKS